MENQKEIDSDWRAGINQTLNPKLKLGDGETKVFVFLDEGNRFKHPDYKPSIIFNVENEQKEKLTWFVNAEAYGVLNQLKALGKLTGLKVSVKRTGIKKSDTRYEIKKV